MNVPLTVGRIIHFYGAPRRPQDTTDLEGGPFAALVVDVVRMGPGKPDRATLKVSDREGNDHVVHAFEITKPEDGPGWMWPPLLTPMPVGAGG